jgi:signal transduction histidine kinase
MVKAASTPSARRKLAQLAAELGAFVGGASDCCALAWDGTDRPLIVAAAGSVVQVLGASADALIGTPAGALFNGAERAARDLAALCEHVPASDERQMIRGGRPFTAGLLLRAGPEGGVVALVRDLAAAQNQADAALRAEDLARFASLVAHEVRNPLSAVKIALQTLERHGSLAQNDLRRVAIATREVGNIELLLNEVLEFARPPTLSLVPVDPRVPVREATEGVEAEFAARGVRFRLTLPERMALVQADPVRLRTAVKILCRQAGLAAEEAQDEGGAEVEVAIRELPEGRWELAVLDSGRQLSQELREKAFMPFTPNRARGSGLGLAVVARIASEHGGEARVEPRPAGGNAIVLSLRS